MTPRHIGIAACSAEGAALCYRTICIEGAAILGPHAHPEVTVHTPSLAAYMACIYRGDWASVGELMLASAHKLKTVGADFLICPDNTIHQALPLVVARSPLPWLHIAEGGRERGGDARLQSPRDHGHALAGRQQGLSRCADGAGTGLHAANTRRAPRDQPYHHGGVGLRHFQAGRGRLFSASHGTDEN